MILPFSMVALVIAILSLPSSWVAKPPSAPSLTIYTDSKFPAVQNLATFIQGDIGVGAGQQNAPAASSPLKALQEVRGPGPMSAVGKFVTCSEAPGEELIDTGRKPVDLSSASHIHSLGHFGLGNVIYDAPVKDALSSIRGKMLAWSKTTGDTSAHSGRATIDLPIPRYRHNEVNEPVNTKKFINKPAVTIGDSGYNNGATLGAKLKNALVTIGSTDAVIKLPAGTYNIDVVFVNYTIPKNITLDFCKGAVLNFTLSSGVVNFYCRFRGDVKFAFSPENYTNGHVAFHGCAEEYPLRWFGAVGDGATDDTNALYLAGWVLGNSTPSGAATIVGTQGDTYGINYANKIFKCLVVRNSDRSKTLKYDFKGATLKILTVPTVPVRVPIASFSRARPGVVTTASAHGLANTDLVRIGGISQPGWEFLNGKIFSVCQISINTFTLGFLGGTGTGQIDTTNYRAAYADSGGWMQRSNPDTEMPVAMALGLHACGKKSDWGAGRTTVEHVTVKGPFSKLYILYGVGAEPSSFTIDGANVMGRKVTRVSQLTTEHSWLWDSKAKAAVLYCSHACVAAIHNKNQKYPDIAHNIAINTSSIRYWIKWNAGVGLWDEACNAQINNINFEDLDIGHLWAGPEWCSGHGHSFEYCNIGTYYATRHNMTATNTLLTDVHCVGIQDDCLVDTGQHLRVDTMTCEAFARSFNAGNYNISAGLGAADNGFLFSVTNYGDESQCVLRPVYGPTTGYKETMYFHAAQNVDIGQSALQGGALLSLGTCENAIKTHLGGPYNFRHPQIYIPDTLRVGSTEIGGLSNTNPCIVTCQNHGLPVGVTDHYLTFTGITARGWSRLINKHYNITVIDADTFSFPVDTSDTAIYPPYHIGDHGEVSVRKRCYLYNAETGLEAMSFEGGMNLRSRTTKGLSIAKIKNLWLNANTPMTTSIRYMRTMLFPSAGYEYVTDPEFASGSLTSPTKNTETNYIFDTIATPGGANKSLKISLAGTDPYLQWHPSSCVSSKVGGWFVVRFLYKADGDGNFHFITNNGPSGTFHVIANDEWRVLYCCGSYQAAGKNWTSMKICGLGATSMPHLWLTNLSYKIFSNMGEAMDWIGD
jgi:hypothetical protein